MSSFSTHKEILADIASKWDQAEEAIKLAEQVTHSVTYPAIAELRYAGRRIVDVLNEIANSNEEARIAELLHDAKFDCLRARHDATDAAASKIALDLEIMRKKLGYNAILKTCPDFAAFTNLLVHINEKSHRSSSEKGKSRSCL